MDAHTPVLLSAVIDLLAPQKGDRFLDCTAGLAGHAAAVLPHLDPGSMLLVDADAENLERAKGRMEALPHGSTIEYRHGNFADIGSAGLAPFQCILADLGVSSVHFDDPTRGFSYRADGPLDLRLNRGAGWTAAVWLERATEKQIAQALQDYGELPRAVPFAALLKQQLPKTTFALKECAEQVYGYRASSLLPQMFQALRIAVNDELGALESLLASVPALLAPGGRMAVISFHSLEDRLVKRAFRELATAPVDPLTGQDAAEAEYELLTKKAIVPTEEETHKNPRSRSAKLRAIRRRQT